jgi:PAS domain S-box-containing protein
MNQKPTYEELEQRVRYLENVEFERKKGLKELDETEDRYFLIYKSILDAVLVADINRRIIDCNPAFTDLFGYAIDEIIGKPTRCIYATEEESKKIGNKIIECIDAHGFFIAAHYRKKSGQVFPGEESVHYVKNSHGKVTGLIGSIRDITERKQKEEALRKSEMRYRLLADNVSDVIWTMGTDRRFTYVSPSIVKLLGYTPREALQLSLKNISTPESYEKVVQVITKAIATENGHRTLSDVTLNLELEHIRKDGGKIYVEITTSFVRNEEGLLSGFIGISRDITKRKRIEEQRDKLIADLQKTLSEVKTLRGFLPICSHCKKIRDDKGYWNQIEAYIRDRSDAEFSHGICPECVKKLYPDMDLYDDNGEVTED